MTSRTQQAGALPANSNDANQAIGAVGSWIGNVGEVDFNPVTAAAVRS